MTDLKFNALYKEAIKLLNRADHLLDEAYKSHSNVERI